MNKLMRQKVTGYCCNNLNHYSVPVLRLMCGAPIEGALKNTHYIVLLSVCFWTFTWFFCLYSR